MLPGTRAAPGPLQGRAALALVQPPHCRYLTVPARFQVDPVQVLAHSLRCGEGGEGRGELSREARGPIPAVPLNAHQRGTPTAALPNRPACALQVVGPPPAHLSPTLQPSHTAPHVGLAALVGQPGDEVAG